MRNDRTEIISVYRRLEGARREKSENEETKLGNWKDRNQTARRIERDRWRVKEPKTQKALAKTQARLNWVRLIKGKQLIAQSGTRSSRLETLLQSGKKAFPLEMANEKAPLLDDAAHLRPFIGFRVWACSCSVFFRCSRSVLRFRTFWSHSLSLARQTVQSPNSC